MSRRVVFYVASSLDGFIAGENGELDWLFDPYAHGYEFFYEDVDTVIMGRKTYDSARDFEDSPYSSKRGYVFTRTAKPAPYEGMEFTTEDPVALTRRLREEDGGMIWLVGGREISELLLEAGLVDELIISVHPKILVKGVPLIASKNAATDLKLVTYEVFKSGLVQLRYEVLKVEKPVEKKEKAADKKRLADKKVKTTTRRK
jgi:dihydrofolate reductase